MGAAGELKGKSGSLQWAVTSPVFKLHLIGTRKPLGTLRAPEDLCLRLWEHLLRYQGFCQKDSKGPETQTDLTEISKQTRSLRV